MENQDLWVRTETSTSRNSPFRRIAMTRPSEPTGSYPPPVFCRISMVVGSQFNEVCHSKTRMQGPYRYFAYVTPRMPTAGVDENSRAQQCPTDVLEPYFAHSRESVWLLTTTHSSLSNFWGPPFFVEGISRHIALPTLTLWYPSSIGAAIFLRYIYGLQKAERRKSFPWLNFLHYLCIHCMCLQSISYRGSS